MFVAKTRTASEWLY